MPIDHNKVIQSLPKVIWNRTDNGKPKDYNPDPNLLSLKGNVTVDNQPLQVNVTIRDKNGDGQIDAERDYTLIQFSSGLKDNTDSLK